MPNTYERIATNTLASPAASILFTGIPSTYTDLKIVFSNITSSAGAINLHWNSDSSSNYSSVYFGSDATAVTTQTFTNDSRVLCIAYQYGVSSATPQMSEIDVMGYSNTAIWKTALVKQTNEWGTVGGTARVVSLWRSTAAISSILFDTNGSDLNAGCKVSIYGIKAA